MAQWEMAKAMFNVTSLRNFLKRRNRAPYVILADGESVTFQRNNEALVRSTDLICLEFHHIGGASYNTHEGADGFQDLMKYIGQELPQ